ncbi:type VI secretion system tip protein VgrG, partial [Enterovibrio sp. ZSDZ35]|nr:type VI secretion system tip protein VgrG [Enterovibrio sp. ZSDZ35]
KDMNLLVQNDRKDHIKHDLHLDVENERFQRIRVDDHLTVEGNQHQHVKNDKTIITDSTLHVKADNGLLNEAGSEIHLKSGHKSVLEAYTEVTLKVGGNFVKIDPAGVHIVGSVVNINSGGSAGSGSGFGGEMPMLPLGVNTEVAPDDIQLNKLEATEVSMSPLLKSRQIAALKTSDPVCEQCEESR